MRAEPAIATIGAMPTITIDTDTLTVHLTRAEQLAGLRRGIRVPLSSVTGVAVVADALAAARGMRAPGLAIPHRTKIGTWRGRGHRQFICARRGVPAVRIRLSGTGDDELVLSVPDAEAHARRLTAATRAA